MNTTKSSSRIWAQLITMSCLAGGLITGLALSSDAQAKPVLSEDKNGNYWCSFDNANGGTIDAGPFNGSKGEPDCEKVCGNYANGTNCGKAVVSFRPIAAEKAPEEREPAQ